MMTLTQLYDLGLNENIDIFDGISLPSDSSMDRNVLISTIMEHCGLNIPMYSDPMVMHSAITLWSAKNQYTFIHINKIYEADYSPIENTDKYESVIIDHKRDMIDNTKGNSSKNENNSISNHTGVTENKTSTHSGTDTTTDTGTVSAYNSSTYQPENETTSSLVHGEAITDTASGSTDTAGLTYKKATGNQNTDKTVNENEKTSTTTRMHGNIGTVTNTKLQGDEYELLGNFNPYTFIAGLFENELTLFVY